MTFIRVCFMIIFYRQWACHIFYPKTMPQIQTGFISFTTTWYNYIYQFYYFGWTFGKNPWDV